MAAVVDGVVDVVVTESPVASGAGSGADAETATALPASTCGGIDAGGAEACISASAGPPAIAAQSAMGTARRAFFNPRVVRTPTSPENAGAARPPLHSFEALPATF